MSGVYRRMITSLTTVCLAVCLHQNVLSQEEDQPAEREPAIEAVNMENLSPEGRDYSRRPNIVLIMTDQQFGGAMSCTGNPWLKTPAMDSLAARGMRFDRAYCGQPLCVPSRAAMMSGRYPHETRVEKNMGEEENVWDFQRWPIVANVLAQAGYDCNYNGKWHLPYPREAVAQHGFGKDRTFFRAKRNRPFFHVESYLNPHDICEWARGQHKPTHAAPPPPDQCPPLPDNFAIPAEEPSVVREYLRQSSKKLGTDLHTPDRWRQYLWVYYRLVESVDREIGRFLYSLRARGNDENTIIIFTSDHGDGMGSHQINQKWLLYEEEIRVPLIITCSEGAGRVDAKHLVSTGWDLMPTICDWAGVTPPCGLSGRSLRPLVEQSPPADWRDQLVVETTVSGGIGGRVLHTGRHKYIVYAKGENREQLFDLEKDPGEMRSVAGEELVRHRALLPQWAKQTGDTAALKFIP